jgi:hypothetical protein
MVTSSYSAAWALTTLAAAGAGDERALAIEAEGGNFCEFDGHE